MPFWGVCPYGLYELVYPVVANNKIQCILFIGNQSENINFTSKKARYTCRVTHVDYLLLEKHFQEIENADKEYSFSCARLIETFVLLHLKTMPKIPKSNHKLHWAISNIKDYADVHFKQQITLKTLSKLYFLNEKYAGRLFHEQVGTSFNRYVTDIRLNNAALLLKTTDKSILTAALESGFNSISYFNRMFKGYYGKTPGEYRKSGA